MTIEFCNFATTAFKSNLKNDGETNFCRMNICRFAEYCQQCTCMIGVVGLIAGSAAANFIHFELVELPLNCVHGRDWERHSGDIWRQ